MVVAAENRRAHRTHHKTSRLPNQEEILMMLLFLHPSLVRQPTAPGWCWDKRDVAACRPHEIADPILGV